MIKRKLGFLLAFLWLFNSAQAQVFTAEKEKYLQDVTSFLQGYNKREGKKFIEEFEPFWLSDKISDGDRAEIYEVSNKIVEKKLRPFPHFHAYLLSIKYFYETDHNKESYSVWRNTLQEYLKDRNKKRLEEFIVLSGNLLGKNILYESRVVRWEISGGEIRFTKKKAFGIDFKGIDLKDYANKDSSVIYNTSGEYAPSTNTFRGTGGKITWVRAKLDEKTTFAELNRFKLSLKTASYRADSVKFTNEFFENPLIGKVTEKLPKRGARSVVIFPLFESYDKRLAIKDIAKDVDYEGGFTMKGAKLIGSGTYKQLARVTFNRNQLPFITSEALTFQIEPDKIVANRAKVNIRIAEDSIVHPGIQIQLNKKDNKLTMIRNKEGIGFSPFFNSYHQVEMYIPAIYWRQGSSNLEMGAVIGSTDHKAKFESLDFFNKSIYDQIQGIDEVHPLAAIDDYSTKIDEVQFAAKDLATSMRRTLVQVKPQLIDISNKGFISYDLNTGLITVKRKLYNYLHARTGKNDYDVIQFVSEVGATQQNGVINLESYDMNLKGVTRVMLSQPQYVKVYPKSKELVVSKNRNFTFSGSMVVGSTEYFGDLFSFEYDKFKLNLVETDSMRLRVRPFEKGEGGQARLSSIIEGVRGHILIDDVTNKSGTDTSYHNYPILYSNKETFVFYDANRIHNGIYKRDKFYFTLEPFIMDSLDNFTKSGFGLAGKLTSAGIFEEFEEDLCVMEDYSLGFDRSTPDDGYGLYADKAKYKNKIKLWGDGLNGNGTIDFLTSFSEAEKFIFFPDSTQGVAQKFTNRESKGELLTPDVVGEDVFINFIPKNKLFTATTIDIEMKFFKEEAKLKGKFYLNPKSANGRGVMNFGKGELASRNFLYSPMVIDADTSSFKLNSLEEDSDNSLAFKTNNVNAHVDFVTRKGEFKSNGDDSFVEFPAIQYICFMDVFNWYMDTDDIELESSKRDELVIDSDLDLTGSNFWSIHPDQDSLNFMAPKARYDIKKKKLTCNELDHLNIADAKIYPDSQMIIIRKKARIETLENASIVANSVTKYHNVFNAKVDITSRLRYQAEGDYIYTNEDKEEQKIHFADIAPDTTNQTYAKGEIKEEESFTLSPHFEYKGYVELFSSRKALVFSGATRLTHDCDLSKSWMNFVAEVDPLNVEIPLSDSLYDDSNNQISAGIVMNQDSTNLYSTFLSSKNSDSHFDVLKAGGILVYNKEEKAYQISNKEKLTERSLPGNFLSLSKDACSFEGDGRLDLGCNYGQILVSSVGGIKHNTVENKIDLNLSMAVDFHMNSNAMDKMAGVINATPDIEPLDFSKKNYEKSLRELVGLKQADKLISDLSLSGKVKKLPEQLQVPLFLAEIAMKWNKEEGSYQSTGKIGIANIGKKQIFKYVDGHIELKKRRGGDVLNIYIQPDENTWYFFTYSKGVMETLSSNDDFNSIVQETKEDKTKFKSDRSKEKYQFILAASKRKMKNFIRQFEE